MSRRHQIVAELLQACGININGDQPWDIRVHNPRFFDRVLSEGSLGLGESYMEGWWDCPALDELVARGLSSEIYQHINFNSTLLFEVLKSKLLNLQTRVRSKQVAKVHYNLDNDLYQTMLGPSMAYTCGYWLNADNLDDAQYRKYDLICRKLALASGERLLEFGCGWGGFAKFAAEHYGVEVVAVNIAEEQIAFARSQAQGLPIEYCLSDYRDSDRYNPSGRKFDKVVSIGLCEHIGYKNYSVFLDKAVEAMKEDGLFLLHTIGSNVSTTHIEPWHGKYIFPGGVCPSLSQIVKSIEKTGLIVADTETLIRHYDKTLISWLERFMAKRDLVKDMFDEKFVKMWSFYLASCAAAFRYRDLVVFQLQIVKNFDTAHPTRDYIYS